MFVVRRRFAFLDLVELEEEVEEDRPLFLVVFFLGSVPCMGSSSLSTRYLYMFARIASYNG